MIFTPQQSAIALKALTEQCKLNFTDCSYKNDVTDSISCEINGKLLIIGFPNIWDNSEPEHEEEFNTFNVFYQDTEGDRIYLTNESFSDLLTFEETINTLNSFEALNVIKRALYKNVKITYFGDLSYCKYFLDTDLSDDTISLSEVNNIDELYEVDGIFIHKYTNYPHYNVIDCNTVFRSLNLNNATEYVKANMK